MHDSQAVDRLPTRGNTGSGVWADAAYRSVENRWRSHAHLLFGNWINEVYQATPYDRGGGGGVHPAIAARLGLAG